MCLLHTSARHGCRVSSAVVFVLPYVETGVHMRLSAVCKCVDPTLGRVHHAYELPIALCRPQTRLTELCAMTASRPRARVLAGRAAVSAVQIVCDMLNMFPSLPCLYCMFSWLELIV